MSLYLVVNQPKKWSVSIPGVTVVAARDYLTGMVEVSEKAKIFNLCHDYGYQSMGYYVSLLAEARGHRPLPSIDTIQDFSSQVVFRGVYEDWEGMVNKSLAKVRADEFQLSIYFGRNMESRHNSLALNIFNAFPAPFLRAHFEKNSKTGKWELDAVKPIAMKDIPETHMSFMAESAHLYFEGKGPRRLKKNPPRYEIAILYQPQHEESSPSDDKAIEKFIRAGDRLGLRCEVINRDDFGRLSEFDGLFIRQTTHVKHHTFRFSRRASAEGLVVIDDPTSILKCTNKVYLAEVLQRHRVPAPKTLIVHKQNAKQLAKTLGVPCVLKQPDSAFSQGVLKVEDEDSLHYEIGKLLSKSELVIAQPFIPTDFDWRIGIIDNRILYACKYFMAGTHWQIIKRTSSGIEQGRGYAVPLETVPKRVLSAALKAARLIGDGLYGVDVKEINGKPYVIEVNDNPSIDSDVEDLVLKDALYQCIMQSFLQRIERQKRA